MWDQAADGYARGEGVCVFFLKTLSQALRDGDRIDALIRESAINSDGRTKGIALPSAQAQAALIRRAYENSGLDMLRVEDRPQYIEAHGTGTQAGDPIEASALSQSLFPPGHEEKNHPPIFVGSIKTIIGHTEGCAGIAGILKALLAMQHKIIPPNQHFHNLNPNIKPYYGNLQIATRPRQWPPVPSRQPLRASINGFGSGGTNCHVILETYVPEVHDHGPWGKAVAKRNVPAPTLPDTDFTPIPLVFSAISDPALSVMVKRYADHLQQTDVPLQSLAMTLHSHRSLFPARIAFTGTSKMAIVQAMNKELTKLSQSLGAEIGTRVPAIEFDENRRPRIIGIFTGQGAQWAGMGQDLIKRNTLFRKTVEDMETSLGALPDPPAWSLKDELMAPPAESRLSEAEISLPLCTAVQVGLTRLLSAAGITFHTVVGHSGGEVAAAYAAGKISASAAVAISYYRGVYVKLASRLDEKAGKMIAVGFGYDEGMKFCSSPSMEGRLCVGASNSPKSVTLSGDEDAVLEAKAIFDKDGLFNRVLKVDKAYHSPHVYPAGQPYIDALESCNIAAGQGNGTTHWVSSVYDDMRTMDSTEDEELRANYWKENLVRTVLFSQAVERAVDDGRGSLDLILEVGPHPALKGPTLETIRSKLGSEVPYSGVLDRKAEDVTAFSKALGFVWTHLGPACVDFGGFLSSFDDSEGKLNTKPLPNLPSYPWDHKQILWKESRYNKQIRLRTEGPHELLGSRTGDDTDFEPRWRNYLKLDEIPWLQDHIIQNQIITPAATYCVMALEAAKVLCKGKSVKSIELRNIDIMRPIILDEASEGAEILLSLRSDLDSNSKSRADLIHADFSLSSGMIEDHHLRTCATGEIRIVLASDEPATVDFSATRPTAPRAELLPVNVNQFYESLGAIGLDYRNSFRALTKLERRLDMASAVVSIDETAKSLVVHPTWLDACFQTFFAAFASPQDGSLSTPFMPTTISRMVFSPTLSSNRQDRPGSFTTDTQINSITPGYQTTLPKLAGDINVYDCKTGKLELRIEDFTMSSFLPATEKDDRSLYLSIVMKQDILSGALFDVMEPMIAPRDRRVIDACERVVDHYLSVLGADERLEDVAGTSPALKGLVRQAAYRGSRAVTPAELSSIFEEFGDHPDLVLVKTIGDKILGHSKSSTPEDGASLADMITRWHNVGLGFTEIHSHIVSVARQIAHKHAHLRILQVGPSSAKLVRDVYHALGNAVSSYVIADESPEALNTMGEELLPDGVGVDIKQFDFEHQTQEIGSVFGETSFDLVIAHKAFIKQPAALRTVRSLMRPGAFLLMMAATGRQLRFPFFLLSGSPPVMADDETAQPQIGNPTREEVHSLLQRCGFSGVDSMALDNVWEKHTFSLAVSQAVDDHIRFMRAPLSLPPPSAATRGKLLLLGGSSSKIATVVQAIRTTLGTTWRGEVVGIESLDVLTPDQVNGVEIAVSLADLDGPVLDGMSLSAFKNLQLFLKGPKVVLWVTQGARSDSPYQNGTIGLMRSFQSENPQRVVQLLDVDATESAATIVAESLLRLDAGVICGEGETGESRLWVVEPELVVQHGKYLIPRVMPDRERNDRLNALRRKVEIQTSLETQPVTLLRSLRDSGEVVYAAHEAPQERSRLAVLRSAKTYLLFGLSGQIGQSMCRWMFANGVRHLVVTSRNPDKNAAWKIELEEQGAQILLESADVAKKQDLVDLRNRVVAFMPPIGGVANGAMVLADQNFADMSYEAFADSQRPKVEGSKNLEEVFSRDALDFFLMFSSISAVTGQRFQANYAAANNFMVGLAAQMRTRNVPAAVIDIGMVIGIGVVSAATAADGSNAMMAALRKVDYMPVSERDLHHLLAEGILAARSSGPFEITTGLEVYSTTGNQPFWHKNPLFSHLIANTKSSKVGKVSGDSAQKPLREKLEGAVGPDDRIRTMEEAFMAYLESSLKLPSKSIYTDLPLIDLGIDSLVAVEIRNWISVETGHDIPVLKILGGSSIKQICTDVAASFQGSKPNATETQPQPHVTPSPTTEVKSSEAKGPEVDSSLSPPLRPISRPSSAECSLASRSSDTDATSGISLSKPPLPATYRTAPLSRGQSRLYFLAQYLEDVTVLNCTISYRLSGPLDAVKLEKSLEAASNRHETLRTIFYTDELSGQPVQGVMDRSRFKLKTSPGFDDPTGEKEFDMLHQYHYDLEQGDTFHATLLSHGADSHTIIFAYHHIVMDGVSWQVFLQDLSAFYNDPSSVISPPPLPTQYIDFTLKQQRDLSAGAYTERLEFFKDQFSRPVDPLPLFPFAKVSTRKSATSYRVRDIVRHIDTGLLSAMKKRSQESRTTSSHFFFAALQIMLHRLLDIEEICIGMVDANRSDQSFGNTIGFFLETLPILFQVDGRQKFSDVLQATRIKAYKALSQTGVPMEEILRACNISASATETPLFQVVFNYRMGAGRTSSLQGVDMEYLAYADAKHTFDLVVSVDELPDGTAMITLSVQDYLYDQEGADLLIDTYIHLLRELSRDTSQTVGSVPVFNNDLAKHAVALGTGVRLEPPPRSVGTLSKMIHAWVESDPEGLAVKDGQGRTRTYRGLSQRAAAISATLLGERIRPGSPVSVFLDPEVDTIATILGILQIGATYVPLDIRNTDEAVADIQQECGATLMIYHSATGQRAREIQNLLTSPEQVRMISLDMIAPEAVPEIEDVSTPEGVAMILYTSGSTGKPKGIPLTHGNLRTTIIGVTERVGLGREVMLQQCCQGFDSAIFQIFNCLANGGTLIIADNRCDPAELAQLMAREGVTCGLFIVSEMQSMLKYGYEALGRCSSWRIAMVAGEAFTANLLDQFRSLKRPDLKIVNTYGPTEAAICSSQYEILPDDSVITIGKPLANYGVYIVDEECNPVPVGWPGELVICGPGIASGYIDLPELTRAKFRNHVFEGAPPEWDRAYLTGDRGRMMSDGSILVSGRMNGDGEVKIRGMRVQLDDVARELVYASKGNLVDAAILVRGGGAENQNLIAFVVFASTSDVESKEVYLRRLIQELPIPRYMRPTIAVPLDTLPVTGRGKLDRRKLAAVPLPQLSGTGTDDEELTEAEIRLRRVWRAALGDISSSVQIRRSSDFFSVGGNSLLLIPLRLEIRRVFAVDISIPELFQTSTLELMAARLSGKSQEVNIDWEEETQLDDAFLATLPRTMIDTAPVSELSVLLTGATGFLGTALLRELVRLPNVAHIHCVAVRANPQNGHRRLGVESPKIIQYPGDLALPYLGMEEADLTVLFKKVHFVIHNGAEVSHMKNYRSLRDSNFISTITLTRLAAQRQIPIHYVSTGGVARLSGAVVQPESSLEAFKPPADGSDGYVASKWASEVFLEKVHRHSHGQGIWIHRPSNITGDDVPALDIVHSVLRFSKLLRAVPSLKGSTGAFDFIHVDSVAKDIAWHVLTSRDEKGATPAAPLCYVHHSGEEVVPVDQLRNYIAASVAGPVKTLSLKDWVASAVEQGLDEVVASFLLASNGVIRVPVLQRTRR
ncbi:hypothetical protein FJTKL_12713 [Diaporthe vaccinii]|uniref:Polyketide synthase n=1 Tax=Diaporthe vaccinii TaxID=105482 RepID=A0ABR4ECV1_9PEZI